MYQKILNLSFKHHQVKLSILLVSLVFASLFKSLNFWDKILGAWVSHQPWISAIFWMLQLMDLLQHCTQKSHYKTTNFTIFQSFVIQHLLLLDWKNVTIFFSVLCLGFLFIIDLLPLIFLQRLSISLLPHNDKLATFSHYHGCWVMVTEGENKWQRDRGTEEDWL